MHASALLARLMQATALYITGTLLRLHAHCTPLHGFNLPVHAAPDSGCQCTLFDSENNDNDERWPILEDINCTNKWDTTNIILNFDLQQDLKMLIWIWTTTSCKKLEDRWVITSNLQVMGSTRADFQQVGKYLEDRFLFDMTLISCSSQ